MKLATIAYRNISRNRRRSFLCIMAIAIAAMSIVLLFSFLAGMKADMRNNIQSFFTGQVRVRHAEYDDKEQLNPLHLRVTAYEDLLERIDGLEGVSAAVPRISFPGFAEPPTVSNPDGENVAAMGIGLDFSREEAFQEVSMSLREGRLPEQGKFEMMIGSGLAQKLDKKLGDSVTILTTTMRRGANAATFTITGIADFRMGSLNQSYYYIPLDRAQHLLGMGDSVTEVLVKFEEGVSDSEAENRVSAVLDPESKFLARDWRELNLMVQYMDIADIAYSIIAFIFFVLASTVIVNSIMMIIYERMREIGTIGALGMQGNEIVRLFFLEAFFLALIGTIAGVVIGIGLTLLLSYTGIDFSSSMQGVDIEISNIIYPKLNLVSTVGVFFFAVAVASLSSLIPTRRAAKIEPVEALRHL